MWPVLKLCNQLIELKIIALDIFYAIIKEGIGAIPKITPGVGGAGDKSGPGN